MGREEDDWNELMGEWVYSLGIGMRVHVNAGAFIRSLNGVLNVVFTRYSVQCVAEMVALQYAYRTEG